MAELAKSRRLPRLLFWAAAAFAFAMAALPNPIEVPGAPSDKVQHILAFLTLAILARWGYPAVRKRWLLLGLAVLGAAIELVQAIPALNRDADPLDWVADVAAATAVFAAVALWPSLTRRRAGRA